MKRTVKAKNLIAFAAVLILLFSITAIPASAEFPPLTPLGRRVGSWILAGLTALNITLTSTVATSKGADILNFLGDPFDNIYSYTEFWEDKPTIQIWDDYTTIDGVTYTDIWLSNEAAQKFKTDGMDFATAYSIASNTNGTFASGEGYAGQGINTVPIFDVDSVLRSQAINVPMVNGDYAIDGYRVNIANNGLYKRLTLWNRETGEQYSLNSTFTQMYTNDFPVNCYVRATGGTNTALAMKQADETLYGNWGTRVGNYTSSPFDFDWTAGTIDPTVLDPDEGIMIRVPSDTPGLQNFITNNYYLTDPTEIDVQLDPDIQGKLDDLIDIIAPILINLDSHDVQYTTNHEAPAPVPDVPIVDATVDQVTQPIINEITNYGDQITQQIPNIIETIPTIDDICNNIDTAPYHDLDTGLDKLPSIFLPFITDLRSALGIWHYVTEWLGMIGTSFSFVTGVLAGTAIMTPIYAAIAGYMCIKVYRRMTG